MLRSTAFVASSLRKIPCEIKTVECTLSDREGGVEGFERITGIVMVKRKERV
jgi:hypothetical protein